MSGLGAGRLASIDGPLGNDTIGFTYDELGRVKARTINSVTASVIYDALGRVTNVTNALGAFTYAYDGLTQRIASIAGPNGLTRAFSYYPQAKDKQLQQILNTKSGAVQVSKFNYHYNTANQITSWTQQSDSSPAKQYTLAYDNADQLYSAVQKDVTSGSTLKRYGYIYDKAGNRTAEQIDDAVTTTTYDNANKMLSITSGVALLFKGSVNELASVDVGGNPATVNATNTFSGAAVVPPGTSNVPVVAIDYSGNMRTNTYSVTQATGTKTPTYDANGNLTGDGTRTYEWDGEDPLAAINQGTHRTEFSVRRSRRFHGSGVCVRARTSRSKNRRYN